MRYVTAEEGTIVIYLNREKKLLGTENSFKIGWLLLIVFLQISRGRITDLFSPEFRRSTILLWIIWWAIYSFRYTHTLLYIKYLSRISLFVDVYFPKLANELKTKRGSVDRLLHVALTDFWGSAHPCFILLSFEAIAGLSTECLKPMHKMFFSFSWCFFLFFFKKGSPSSLSHNLWMI